MYILKINVCYQNIKTVAFHAVLISKDWALDMIITGEFANKKGLGYPTLNSLNLNSDNLLFYAKWSILFKKWIELVERFAYITRPKDWATNAVIEIPSVGEIQESK